MPSAFLHRERPLAAALLLAALPAGLALVATILYGVDLPYWDEWELVPLLEKLDRGTLGAGDLWAPHNEHRLVFPRAILVLLAAATDWDVRFALGLNLLLALGIFLLSWRLLERTRRSVRPFSPPSWWLGPLVALLVFGLVQWENFLWGWQVQIFLATLAVLAGFGLLADAAERWSVLLLAAGLGVVATGSFGVGLLFWPLALVPIARPASGRTARIFVWTVLSALVIGASVHGLQPTPPDPGREGLDLVLHLGAYFALWIGSPLLQHVDHQVALWGGFAATIAFAVLATALLRFDPRRARTARWLWITVGAFALASAGLTALGRVHLGIGQALSSRYTTVSNLFWIALLGLLVTLPPARIRPGVARATGLVAASLLVWQSLRCLPLMAEEAAVRRDVREALRRGEATNLEAVYPHPEMVLRRLETLDDLGLGPRRDLDASSQRR